MAQAVVEAVVFCTQTQTATPNRFSVPAVVMEALGYLDYESRPYKEFEITVEALNRPFKATASRRLIHSRKSREVVFGELYGLLGPEEPVRVTIKLDPKELN